MRNAPVDPRLYLVTDDTFCRRPLEEMVREAVEGGVTVVQLRLKQVSSRELFCMAVQLGNLLRPQGIPLFINDRLDIALAAGADGVHLGRTDLPWREARRLAPNPFLIGASVRTVSEALEAESAGVDYVAVSPVFVTPTKPDAESPVGLEGIRRIRQAVRIPLVAIGGIHIGNAAEVIRAGCDGVAVVSAILGASDIRAAALELRRIVDQPLKERNDHAHGP